MNYKILSVFTFLLAAIPATVFAQSRPMFETLVNIPLVTANSTDIGQYINALYILSISIAALLAVIKIIIAGVKYMLSDVVTSKAEAKGDIKGALGGLLIVISAVVVLETINPQLRVLSVFITPVSQMPPRATQTAPTATGQAPLPGPTASATDVRTECSDAASCEAARTACINSAPNAWIDPARTNTNQVTCTYGSTRNITCDTRSRGGTRDCNIYMRARCPSGSTYTETSAITATCFMPNRVRPEALPQSGGA
jgi:hypothetical protein